MNTVSDAILFLVCLLLLPLTTIGIIRKVKAWFQNRCGPSLLQPFFNLSKLMQKDETVSKKATFIFRVAPIVNLCSVLLLAFLVPWLSFKPTVPGEDLILVVYLLALGRFFTMLAAVDTGSSFGAFAASREGTISLLAEPALILSLAALSLHGQSTNLETVFAFSQTRSLAIAALWSLSGLALFIFSMVELSRMPVDDPTTHLELT
ncbi:MAG TPA: NADH-quinone oxidoreductase subunit H, partial [Chroococcales cyanobacterium]